MDFLQSFRVTYLSCNYCHFEKKVTLSTHHGDHILDGPDNKIISYDLIWPNSKNAEFRFLQGPFSDHILIKASIAPSDLVILAENCTC